MLQVVCWPELLERGDHSVYNGRVSGSERGLWSLGEIILDTRHLQDVFAMRNECGIGAEQFVEVQELIDLEHVPHNDHGQVRERELYRGEEANNICKLWLMNELAILFIFCTVVRK